MHISSGLMLQNNHGRFAHHMQIITALRLCTYPIKGANRIVTPLSRVALHVVGLQRDAPEADSVPSAPGPVGAPEALPDRLFRVAKEFQRFVVIWTWFAVRRSAMGAGRSDARHPGAA